MMLGAGICASLFDLVGGHHQAVHLLSLSGLLIYP